MHNPLSIIPDQRGSGVYHRLRDDDSSSDAEPNIISGGFVVLDPRPRFVTPACSETEFASVQRFLDDDRDLGSMLRLPRPQSPNATIPTITFETIDS